MTTDWEFAAAECVPFNVWSASVPLIWLPCHRPGYFRPWTVDGRDVRPWNGRVLTQQEVSQCFRAFLDAWDRTQEVGYAAQAAYEWLSANAP